MMVRPVLGYGATVWLNGTRTQHNEKLLNGVQRLANVLITGTMPSTPGVALDVITGNILITLWLYEESAKGALRLKTLISGNTLRLGSSVCDSLAILQPMRNSLSRSPKQEFLVTRKHHLSISTKDSQWTFPTGTCSARP